MEEKVVIALNEIRPSLQADGGDLEYVRMDGNTVYVKLVGACAGCPMSQMTLKGGVERYLQDKVDSKLIVESI
ncbi:MAG: NifU family protein [Spirochaetaceae bacterium]|nr:NifU family protein [Spirochaetaceae bacterium]